jgi:hypothetical protein
METEQSMTMIRDPHFTLLQLNSQIRDAGAMDAPGWEKMVGRSHWMAGS